MAIKVVETMKVSVFWRLACLFILGFALGMFLSFRYIQKNTPVGQSIEIGKVKIKGKGQEISGPVINIIQERKDPEKDKKRRRR